MVSVLLGSYVWQVTLCPAQYHASTSSDCPRIAGPRCPSLDHTSVLLLVLIRDCKINKMMLLRVGVPAIVRMLRRHAHPAVSSTTVQALSGVLTLLAMSKTMLDLVLQMGGLKLVLELLAYKAHDWETEADVSVRLARSLSICALWHLFRRLETGFVIMPPRTA